MFLTPCCKKSVDLRKRNIFFMYVYVYICMFVCICVHVQVLWTYIHTYIHIIHTYYLLALTLTPTQILFLQPETTATFGSIHRLCQSNWLELVGEREIPVVSCFRVFLHVCMYVRCVYVCLNIKYMFRPCCTNKIFPGS